MKPVRIILYISSLLLLASCGSNDTFTVITQVEGLGTQNVRAVYRTGGRLKVTPAMSLDGKFSITGSSETPTLIDLYTASRGYIGSVVAHNGETVEATFTLNEPASLTVKGDKISEEMTKFIKANAQAINDRDATAINDAVKNYIVANPRQGASPYILMSLFVADENPVLADSLLSLIDESVRPASDILTPYRQLLGTYAGTDSALILSPITLYSMGDSMATIKAGGRRGVLLAFTNHKESRERDLEIATLNTLRDSLKTQARIVEIACNPDSAGLVTSTKARYTVCWEPAAIASGQLSRLGVHSTPWFVSADSTGHVIYSGDDITQAIKLLTH